MLTKTEEAPLDSPTETDTQSRPAQLAKSLKNESEAQVRGSEMVTSPVSRMLRLAWLAQTVASICWIVSVFSYGIEKTGDWLQLAAASAWLLANIATILFPESD